MGLPALAVVSSSDDRTTVRLTEDSTRSNVRCLSVVIPAFNEEEAIEGTLSRCLAAAEAIKRTGSLESIEWIVVSDGSTDRTAEIARSFPEVRVIEFERNQGYGAAIKEGFRRANGSLLAFLDADGTCEPHYFGEMCRVALTEDADVVLGSRLGPDSKMPKVRRLGNRVFALLLGFLCGRWITDTASGMRVVRRSSLAALYPLPDGLHFTPSMSARALLNNLRVIETRMAYQERIGASKLRVIGDGVRFLKTIVSGVLCYRPERLFLIGFTLCLTLGAALAVYPLEYYLHNRRVEEWMIYRFLVCGLLGSAGYQLLSGAALASRMASFGPRRRHQDTFWPSILAEMFEGRMLAGFVGGLTLTSLLLVWPGVMEYLTTARVNLHWSRVVVGAFGLILASQAVVTGVLMKVVGIWKVQSEERV